MSKITVAILAYNYGRYLQKCLDSILKQTRKADEIIVIDDCSTDETSKIIKKYSGKVRYVRNSKNLGLVKTHNKVLKIAKGDYISLVSADDWVSSKILEKELKILDNNPQVAMAYAQSTTITNGRKSLVVPNPAGDKSYVGRKEDFDLLLTGGDFIPGNTAMVRKSVYDKLGVWDKNIIYRSDHEMWIRIAKNYPLAYIAEPLAFYRVHGSNIHLIADFKLSYEKEFSYILKKHITEKSSLKSLAYYNFFITVAILEIEKGHYLKSFISLLKTIKARPEKILVFKTWRSIAHVIKRPNVYKISADKNNLLFSEK